MLLNNSNIILNNIMIFLEKLLKNLVFMPICYSGAEWFNLWFNSPYYYILYKNRNDIEAKRFIDKITTFFSIRSEDKILDIACGKGRYAIYLNNKGYNVEGIDLSKDSIDYAKKFQNERLHFECHDMRKIYKSSAFDFILNMFTSFGYFESEAENMTVIHVMAEALKEKGKLILDFFNTQRTVQYLEPKSNFIHKDIKFYIERKIKGQHIVKDIYIDHKGENFHFQEKVMVLEKKKFLFYFTQNNLNLIDIFGNYNLNPYRPEVSERMIFIAEKSSR